MKLSKRLLAVAGTATAVAAPLLFAASAANAAPATVKVVTHLANRTDTCEGATNVSSPNGNVWAYDNISRQITITNNGHGDYTVNVSDNGSFSAFAQPNNTDQNTFYPIHTTGSIKGTEVWQVTGALGVDSSALSSQTPDSVSTTQMITELLPGGNATMDSYGFNYQSGNGSTYSQTYGPSGSTITGNITG
jgi:hypothetical protein